MAGALYPKYLTSRNPIGFRPHGVAFLSFCDPRGRRSDIQIHGAPPVSRAPIRIYLLAEHENGDAAREAFAVFSLEATRQGMRPPGRITSKSVPPKYAGRTGRHCRDRANKGAFGVLCTAYGAMMMRSCRIPGTPRGLRSQVNRGSASDPARTPSTVEAAVNGAEPKQELDNLIDNRLTASQEKPNEAKAPAGWRRGYAADCKSVKTGSIPVPASK